MGGNIVLQNKRLCAGEPVADILVTASSLHGTVVEGSLIPTLIDEIPVIAVLAAFADGETVIRDASELKFKESDHIATVTEALLAMGCDVAHDRRRHDHPGRETALRRTCQLLSGPPYRHELCRRRALR